MRSGVPNRTALGLPIVWDGADLPLSFVIQDAGSDDIADASDHYAIRRAFAAWGEQPDSRLVVLEDTDPASTARTDWPADDIHLVLFDEDGSSGLFPAGSGLVAITPFEFDTNTGALIDADVVFNGFEQTFATDLDGAAFDLRAVATHEVGHMIGLAHSPLGGATMAPFIQKGAFHKRALSLDDLSSLEGLYPLAVKGRLTGTVSLNGLPIHGAHVWCSGGNGLVVASTLSEADGSFALTGLAPGTYRVIAAPLDSPLGPDDIGALGLPTPDLFFRQSSVAPFTIVGAAQIDVGTIAVGDDSVLAVLSPVVAQVVEAGSTTALSLTVSGVVGGTPSVSVPGSQLSVQNVVFDGGSQLDFDVVVPDGAFSGSFDLEISTTIGTTTSYAGFLEVVPKAPTLDLFAPGCGGSLAAQEVFASGTNLSTTTEFVFGDAAATITAVGVGGGTLAGIPPSHATGTVDLVAITAAGNEARLSGAYLFVDGGIPSVLSAFPAAGDLNGGTTVIVRGFGFGQDSVALFDFNPAASTTLVDVNTLLAVTPALPADNYDVSVLQVGCEADLTDTLPGAFDAVGGTDPTLDLVTPQLLSQAGGEAITVTGTGFVPGSVVELFVDPLSGQGGTSLTTTFVSATQLDAVTPPGPLLGGLAAALVRLPSGQAAVLDNAVDVQGPEILDVTPNTFTQTGDVTLTITGSAFVPGAVAELFTDLTTFTGGTPLATTFVSSSVLTADVPSSLAPLPLGPANVAATFPGPLFGGKADAITIVAPSLDATAPHQVSPAGGETLTLTGTGFTSTAVVRAFVDPVDFTGGTSLPTTFVSDTELSATLPAGPLVVGPASLAVDLPGALIAGLVGGLEVLPPRLDQVVPNEVLATGGETLTLTGFGFTSDVVVRMFADPVDLTGGTVLATTFVSDSQLTAITPPAPLPAGLASVALDQIGAPIVGLANVVNVLLPTLDAVLPSQVSPAGGETLTLTGTGFTPTAVVRAFVDPVDFTGGTALATSFVSDTELTAVLPAGPLVVGSASLAVDLPGALIAGLVDGIEVLPVTLDQVSPTEVSASGGETLTLTGFGFTADALVRMFADPIDFTGGTVLVSSLVSDTELSAVTPPGPLPDGLATLAVDQTGAPTVGLPDAVDVLFPTLEGVDPTLLSSEGGENFTVTGTQFTADAVVELFTDPVTLNGGTALETTFVDTGTLSALTPVGPLPLGPANVAVRMPGDVVIVLQDALEFAALVDNGNKAEGSLGDDDESDLLAFDGIQGAAVTATLKRVGKTDLVPKLVLLDADGVVLLSSDEADPEFDSDFVKRNDKLASLRKFILPSTGRHKLLLTRQSGQGEYRFVFKDKLPKAAKKLKVTKQDAIVLGPNEHELGFDAKAGTLLSGTLKGKRKEGLMLVLERLEAPSGEVLLSTDAAGVVSGDADLVELVKLGKDLISLRFKKLPLPTFGSYRLVLQAADGTSGSLTGSLSLRAPKVKLKLEGL